MVRLIGCIFVVLLLSGFIGTYKPTPYPFPDLYAFRRMPRAADNPVTIEGAELGRYLFYDPILSGNKQISCATCHKQKHAFSDAPNALSIGNKGVLTTRNSMPLFNLAWYSGLFWDGRAGSIEAQVFHPLRSPDEMDLTWAEATKRIKKSKFYKQKFELAFPSQEIDSILIAKAIAQFMRTLISNNSKYDSVLVGKTYFNADEAQGFILVNSMDKASCMHCHSTDADALGTSGGFSNNGLDDLKDPNMYKDKGLGGHTQNVRDNGKFKIPSLRNVALTPPYMHDGRFQTLEEVVDFYSEGVHTSANVDSKMEFAKQGGARLSATEKKQIVAFLKALTDSVFITNPNFSNPFSR